MWMIVYIHDEAPRGWYVIDAVRRDKGFPSVLSPSVLSGPHDNHADAVDAAMRWVDAYRTLGWQP